MAHRGRLNVLAHNLGRPYETIFAEFEGTSTSSVVKAVTDDPAGRHRRRQVPPRRTRATTSCATARRSSSTSSPTRRHLEFVDPVVARRHARRADRRRQGPHADRDTERRRPDHPARRRRLPRPGRRRRDAQPAGARRLQGRRHAPPHPEQPGRLHDRPRGLALDAAGRRTSPRASTSRSSTSTPTTSRPASPPCAWRWPSARSSATTSLIDLIGYRRFGHNEADEPAYTQPEMYAQIKRHERVAEPLRGDSSIEDGVVTKEEVDGWQQDDLGRADAPAPGAQGADQGGAGGRRRRAADRRVPARPHAEPDGRDRGPGRARCARSTRSC